MCIYIQTVIRCQNDIVCENETDSHETATASSCRFFAPGVRIKSDLRIKTAGADGILMWLTRKHVLLASVSRGAGL